MPVPLRKCYLPGHIFEPLPVPGPVSPIVLRLGVMIEVNHPIALNLQHGWPFHPSLRKRPPLYSPPPTQPVRPRQTEVLPERRPPLVLEHHEPLSPNLHHCRVDTIEPRIEEQLWLAEPAEVLRPHRPDPVVVPVVSGPCAVREEPGHCAGPNQDPLLRLLVPHRLRGPGVARVLGRDLDQLLLPPMNQVP